MMFYSHGLHVVTAGFGPWLLATETSAGGTSFGLGGKKKGDSWILQG